MRALEKRAETPCRWETLRRCRPYANRWRRGPRPSLVAAKAAGSDGGGITNPLAECTCCARRGSSFDFDPSRGLLSGHKDVRRAKGTAWRGPYASGHYRPRSTATPLSCNLPTAYYPIKLRHIAAGDLRARLTHDAKCSTRSIALFL